MVRSGRVSRIVERLLADPAHSRARPHTPSRVEVRALRAHRFARDEVASDGARRLLGSVVEDLVSEPLVTARELAEQLGLSASTVLDMWERDELPGFKIGRAVRFRPSEVEARLEGCRRCNQS